MNEPISQILINARKRSQLTQQQVADRAGTAQSAVVRYEKGISSPSIDTLQRLLKANGLELVLDVKPASKNSELSDLYKKVQRNRGAIKEILYAAGATNIRIFGSVARGQDDIDSDVDFLVDVERESGNTTAVIMTSKRLSRIIGVEVNVAPTWMLKSDVRKSALRDAIPL